MTSWGTCKNTQIKPRSWQERVHSSLIYRLLTCVWCQLSEWTRSVQSWSWRTTVLQGLLVFLHFNRSSSSAETCLSHLFSPPRPGLDTPANGLFGASCFVFHSGNGPELKSDFNCSWWQKIFRYKNWTLNKLKTKSAERLKLDLPQNNVHKDDFKR